MSEPTPALFEKLHFDSDLYFEELIMAINKAKSSVALETYIWEPDEMGEWMTTAILEAANRGVQVKVLVDGFGARHWLGEKKKLPQHQNLQIRVWRPILWRGSWGRFFAYTNKRTHRKFCIIDNSLAFVGSQNIDRSHLYRFAGEAAWKDIGIEFNGERVQSLKQGFEYLWERSHKFGKFILRRKIWPYPKNEFLPTDQLRLNLNRRYAINLKKDLLGRIDRAVHRIWIINPYFSPPRALMAALLAAKRRGVDIKMVAPKNSDHFFMPLVLTRYCAKIINAGIPIYEYAPHFIHAKTLAVDEWVTVGTSNLNSRSFLRDFEVDIVIKDSKNLAAWDQHFKEYVKNCKILTHDDLRFRWVSKLLGRFFGWMLRDLL